MRLDVYLLLDLLLLLYILPLQFAWGMQADAFADLGVGLEECDATVGLLIGEVSHCHLPLDLSAVHDSQSFLADVVYDWKTIACPAIEDWLEGRKVQHIEGA